MSFDHVSLRITECATLDRSERSGWCEVRRANMFIWTAVNKDSRIPSTRGARSKNPE